MKRRTLDILFAIGGLGIAALLAVAALVLSANATFANTYVHDQLAAQHITFKPADALTEEERQLPGMTEYGFSEFGTKAAQAAQAATVAWIAAAMMLLLALAGFAHALRTPATEAFAEPVRTTPQLSAA